MGLRLVEAKIRKALDYLLTFFFLDNFRLLIYILRVEGLSSYVENEFLFECAACGYGKGLIVEIGSYMGRSSITLAFGSKSRRREKVYAIDPLPDQSIRKIFIKNIERVNLKDYIISDFRNSEEATKEFNSNIRLLFIDGSHEYGDVKKDILLWKDKLIDGGIIALHDYIPENRPHHCPGINRAIEELIINSKEFIAEGCIDSIFFASKKHSASENNKIFCRFNKFDAQRKRLKCFVG